MLCTLDKIDAEIISRRMDKLNADDRPRVGDYVRFADDVTRRISYAWRDGTGWSGGLQTSDAGSFHLGNYGVSFSGSLYHAVPEDTLTDTGETREGDVWIFHHDMAGADRGVHTQVPFRLYTCHLEATR